MARSKVAILLPILVPLFLPPLGGLMLAAGPASTTQPATAPAAVVPAPGAAKWWSDQHGFFADRAREERIDILFFGDQVVDGFLAGGVRNPSITELKGAHADVFGIATDTSANLLWRVANGEMDSPTVKAIVISTGNRNALTEDAEEVLAGVKGVVAAVREKQPGARIIVLSLVGVADVPPPPGLAVKLRQINEKLAKLDDGVNLRFADLNGFEPSAKGLHTRVVKPVKEPAKAGHRAVKLPAFSQGAYVNWYKRVRPLIADIIAEDRAGPATQAAKS